MSRNRSEYVVGSISHPYVQNQVIRSRLTCWWAVLIISLTWFDLGC
jgi:hypothetical protein